MSMDGRVVVVHNGIVENFLELREELEAEGVRFASDTDTEVIVQLIERYLGGRQFPGNGRAPHAASAQRRQRHRRHEHRTIRTNWSARASATPVASQLAVGDG